MLDLQTLLNTLPQQGKIDWIGLRPGRRQSMISVEHVNADPASGLEGDRYAGRSGKRQVTLIQAEHLTAIASYVGLRTVEAHTLRRNLLISGINLLALKDKLICAGEVTLEITGACHPCSRMEELLGAGGYNAMRGHGGITARVVSGGLLKLADRVFYPESSS